MLFRSTDQGDLKLQIAGLSNGYDSSVELGSAEDRQLSVLDRKSVV